MSYRPRNVGQIISHHPLNRLFLRFKDGSHPHLGPLRAVMMAKAEDDITRVWLYSDLHNLILESYATRLEIIETEDSKRILTDLRFDLLNAITANLVELSHLIDLDIFKTYITGDNEKLIAELRAISGLTAESATRDAVATVKAISPKASATAEETLFTLDEFAIRASEVEKSERARRQQYEAGPSTTPETDLLLGMLASILARAPRSRR